MNKRKVSRRISSKSFPYFDDCPICQSLKQADQEGRNLSLQETLEAFAEAEKVSKKRND